MAHAALSSDPDPTNVLAHSLMTQVTASAHPSGRGKGCFWGCRWVAVAVAAEIHRNVVFLGLVFEARENPALCIDRLPNRARETQGEAVLALLALVCRPNVFAATDVSIANFHLAFPPSPFLHSSPSSTEVYVAVGEKQLFTALPHIVVGTGWGGGATAATVVVWSQSRLLLSTRLARVRSSVHVHPYLQAGGARHSVEGRGGGRAELLCITMMPKSQSTR